MDKYVLDSDYISQLLISDAKSLSASYQSQGVQGVVNHRSYRDKAAKPNAQFLTKMVQGVQAHNQELIRREESLIKGRRTGSSQCSDRRETRHRQESSHREPSHRESSHRESSHRESGYRESSHKESSHRESSHRESSHRELSLSTSHHSPHPSFRSHHNRPSDGHNRHRRRERSHSPSSTYSRPRDTSSERRKCAPKRQRISEGYHRSDSRNYDHHSHNEVRDHEKARDNSAKSNTRGNRSPERRRSRSPERQSKGPLVQSTNHKGRDNLDSNPSSNTTAGSSNSISRQESLVVKGRGSKLQESSSLSTLLDNDTDRPNPWKDTLESLQGRLNWTSNKNPSPHSNSGHKLGEYNEELASQWQTAVKKGAQSDKSHDGIVWPEYSTGKREWDKGKD